METDQLDRLVLFPDRFTPWMDLASGVAILYFGGVTFSQLLGATILQIGMHYLAWIFLFLAVACVLGGTTLIVFAVRQLRAPKAPVLTMDSTGFTIGKYPHLPILWSEIEHAEMERWSSGGTGMANRWLFFEPSDAQAITAKWASAGYETKKVFYPKFATRYGHRKLLWRVPVDLERVGTRANVVADFLRQRLGSKLLLDTDDLSLKS